MNSRTLIIDLLLAVVIAGIFFCLSLVAQAYQMVITIESQVAETKELEARPYEKIAEESSVPEIREVLAVTPESKVDINIEPEAEIISVPEIEIEPQPKAGPPLADVEVVVEPAKKVASKVITTPTKPIPSNDFATELINLIERETNSFRKANVLSPLSQEFALQLNAKNYSESMLKGDFMSHTNKAGCDLTCRFKADGYEASAWGENLAMIKFDNPLSAAEVADYFMKGWKKSSGHRENLLSSDFTHQGVGVSYSNNAVYVSVQFAQQ